MDMDLHEFIEIVVRFYILLIRYFTDRQTSAYPRLHTTVFRWNSILSTIV